MTTISYSNSVNIGSNSILDRTYNFKNVLLPTISQSIQFQWDEYSERNNSVTDIRENILNDIFQLGIDIINPSLIRDYLSLFPDLSEIMLFICLDCYSFFGPTIKISIELEKEERYEDSYLIVSICKNYYEDTFMEQIESIRRNYYNHIYNSKGFLLLTTDFNHPE